MNCGATASVAVKVVPLIVTPICVGTTRLWAGHVVIPHPPNGADGQPDAGKVIGLVFVAVRGSVIVCVAEMQVWPLSAVRQTFCTKPPELLPLP